MKEGEVWERLGRGKGGEGREREKGREWKGRGNWEFGTLGSALRCACK